MKYTTYALVLAGVLGACSKADKSQANAEAVRPTAGQATTPPTPRTEPLADPDLARTPAVPVIVDSSNPIGTLPTAPKTTDPQPVDTTQDGGPGQSDALTRPGDLTPVGVTPDQAAKDLATERQKTKDPQDPKANSDMAKLGTVDAEFIAKAPLISLFAVEASELAVLQASTPFVREFAQLQIEDHGEANRELEQIARGKGSQTPKDLDADHQTRLATLRDKTGVEFDRQYRDMMVSECNDAIALFDRAANDCEDADLKAFASKTLKVLRAHRAKLAEMPPTSGS